MENFPKSAAAEPNVCCHFS